VDIYGFPNREGKPNHWLLQMQAFSKKYFHKAGNTSLTGNL